MVLKSPTIDDKRMCSKIWAFQTLGHNDRTAKSAIFPFPVRKVKKGIPPKSHAFSLKEELIKGGDLQKASLLFEAWRFLADADP
jgi:hypothetical protein